MSDTDPRLASLLSALGAHIGLPGLELNADHVCRLVLDDTVIIDIEHQPGTDNVQAFSVVGPHPGDNVVLLQKLLAANLFGQGTGGAILALDEERGEVLLSHPFDLSTTTTERFISTLEGYVGYVQAWMTEITEILDQEPADSVTSEAAPADSATGYIRV